MHEIIPQLKGKLIVSCQALEGNPLKGAVFMSAMARAAVKGGAAAIRANGPRRHPGDPGESGCAYHRHQQNSSVSDGSVYHPEFRDGKGRP